MDDDRSMTETESPTGPMTHRSSSDDTPTDDSAESKTGRTGLHPVTLFISHLAVGVLSAAAGVVFGGWIAFETGYWHSFRTWIEGLGSDAIILTVGLVLATLILSFSVAVRSSYQ